MSESTIYSQAGKRLVDVILAAGLLIVLAPVMLVTASLVRWKLGRPVLFRQTRPGRYGVPFQMLKFRSMSDARDDRGALLPDDRRLTPVGRFLRSTSLDELPELWHVLRGEMSLVGPRPLLMEYLERYSPEQARRHEVKPGITGLAQVSGRNLLDWHARLQLDLEYVERVSLWLDLKILARTLWIVLLRRGVSSRDHATMPPFAGSASAAGDARDGLVVIGAGGHAKVVIATAQAAGIPVEEIVDDNPALWGGSLFGVPISGSIAALGADRPEGLAGRTRPVRGPDASSRRRRAVIAIGNNDIRRRIARRLDLAWTTVVHPAAVVHPSAVLGAGSVIGAGAVIQPDAVIGSHVIVNTASSIDHDSKLQDFVHVAPGACLAGGVEVAEGALIGMGSRILPRINIGRDALVAAGAVVTRDVPAGSVAIGIPARSTRRHPGLEAA